MNCITFNIHNLPPMPRNRSHHIIRKGKGVMSVKTHLAHEFEKDLENRLQEFKEVFTEFRKSFNPKLHYVKATYIVHTPLELLITKEGHISSRSVDTDAHKILQDTIFRCVGIDDRFIRDFNVRTPSSTDGLWNYTIQLKLEELCNLTNTSLEISNLTESVSLL